MIHRPTETQRLANRLRRSMTLPEVLLWRELRKRPGGLKFRREHPAGSYVLDFFCAELALAIEIDGTVHDCGSVADKDERRDASLLCQGVTVVRFPASDVLKEVTSVVEAILAMTVSLLATKSSP
ncbi:MAG: endonuclease domain-containing protein [Novosphingobium sp.]|nr:endonuclease domain-containing protein [Novosphingobium sp.]MCZ8017801.1 endonuclease domain-containing protein [Novosphingobium sp.]MCZ8033675.1 endonuclease domain-containing protein [Novosphingobium sp.]MCZ8051031.1 endonuclease domain-containing protein [Novosphingobium sp.]MCZ8059377.1 endonuclease domain-containing protein [Novosphingobium sp.]MCZ8231215.1 endonuclease domain-containing protein [Novosphingobium sp.]